VSLAEHLHVGTPLVWVETDEPDRITDMIVAHSQRPVFRIDPFEGVLVYKRGQWRKVLFSNNGAMDLSWRFEDAIAHVYKERGVFIITNAHKVAEEIPDLLLGGTAQYRRAFYDNNKDDLPLQLILLSCGMDIPPEIARHAAVVPSSLPNTAELAYIVTHISNEANEPVLPEAADLTPITRAGLGLTESEFVQACVLSLRERGIIDAEHINNFKRAKVSYGGMLEIRRPEINFDMIGGLDLAKETIKAAVWAWHNPEQAAEFGVSPLRRMLMVGVPGTGKSAICEATANELDLELAVLGVSKMMSKWIGESESNMRRAFAQLGALKPVVAWDDEFGRSMSGGGTSNDGGTTDRVHGEFLTGLQELPDEVFYMAAANQITGLAPEILRADRFDKIMFVGFPTEEERQSIFGIHLGDRASEHNLEELAGATRSFTGAEIKALLKEVRNKISGPQRRHITDEDILQFVPKQKNRMWIRHKQDIIAMYRRALDEWDWASSGQLAEAQDVINDRFDAGVHTKKLANVQVKRWA